MTTIKFFNLLPFLVIVRSIVTIDCEVDVSKFSGQPIRQGLDWNAASSK
jgi:hypothetical protein